MQTFKKRSFNFGLLLAVLIAGFIFLEAACRFLDFGEVPPEKVSYIGHTHYNPFLIFGPNIDKSFPQKSGGPAYFNKQGFRIKGTLPIEKPADEYRVFALGGSTTEDIPNGDNTHYCGEANKILGLHMLAGKKFNCINAAKSGYSSAHTLIRLQFDLLSFKPDMITVMDQINDLTVNFFPADERLNYANKYLDSAYAPSVFDLKRTFLRNSRAAVFLYTLYDKIKRMLVGTRVQNETDITYSFMKFNPEPTKLVFKDVFRNNLRSIAQIAKGNGIKTVFITQPAVFSEKRYALTFTGDIHGVLYPRLSEFVKLFKEYNQIVRDVAAKEKISLIDMEKLMGEDPAYFTDMIHYSPAGIKRFALIYSSELKKIIESAA